MLIIDSDFYILHDNYVAGKFGKELRLKEMNMFLESSYGKQELYLTVELVNISEMPWND
mgnify:CR=1 FL=1